VARLWETPFSQKGNPVADGEGFVSLFHDVGIHRQSIKMVESLARCPGGQAGLAVVGKGSLEVRGGVAREGVTGGYDAALARVDAIKHDIANDKADGGTIVAEQLVFPEGGHAIDFQVGAKALTGICEGQVWIPGGDGLQGGSADQGWPRRLGVIREAVDRILLQGDRLVKIAAHPGFEGGGWAMEVKGCVIHLPLQSAGEVATIGRIGSPQSLNGRRALGVDDALLRVNQGIGAIAPQSSAGQHHGLGHRDPIQRLNGKQIDAGKISTHGQSGKWEFPSYPRPSIA
jgi:hypothetical protein